MSSLSEQQLEVNESSQLDLQSQKESEKQLDGEGWETLLVHFLVSKRQLPQTSYIDA